MNHIPLQVDCIDEDMEFRLAVMAGSCSRRKEPAACGFTKASPRRTFFIYTLVALRHTLPRTSINSGAFSGYEWI